MTTQPEPHDADPTSPGYPWNEQYIRIYFRTMEKRGPSRRRIIGAYQRTLEAAVKAITDRYPSAVFESAKIAQGELEARTARRINLTLDGKVSNLEPEDEEFAEGGEEEMLTPPTPERDPRLIYEEAVGRRSSQTKTISLVDSKTLYNKSYDEEAIHTPGEDDHVRLQRATLTMLRALYLQNEEITAAVTRPSFLLDGVEDEPDEPEDFDAHRCGAFSERTGFGRCVLLDYHEGFPKSGHNFDRQTPCICGKAIWSPACRQEEHPYGVAPESDPRCAYRNGHRARCVKLRHEDSKHTYIRWGN